MDQTAHPLGGAGRSVRFISHLLCPLLAKREHDADPADEGGQPDEPQRERARLVTVELARRRAGRLLHHDHDVGRGGRGLGRRRDTVAVLVRVLVARRHAGLDRRVQDAVELRADVDRRGDHLRAVAVLVRVLVARRHAGLDRRVQDAVELRADVDRRRGRDSAVQQGEHRALRVALVAVLQHGGAGDRAGRGVRPRALSVLGHGDPVAPDLHLRRRDPLSGEHPVPAGHARELVSSVLLVPRPVGPSVCRRNNPVRERPRRRGPSGKLVASSGRSRARVGVCAVDVLPPGARVHHARDGGRRDRVVPRSDHGGLGRGGRGGSGDGSTPSGAGVGLSAVLQQNDAVNLHCGGDGYRVSTRYRPRREGCIERLLNILDRVRLVITSVPGHVQPEPHLHFVDCVVADQHSRVIGGRVLVRSVDLDENTGRGGRSRAGTEEASEAGSHGHECGQQSEETTHCRLPSALAGEDMPGTFPGKQCAT